VKRDRWLLLAFFLSGAAALGYEILWTRLLSLALGSETLGILGTLAGFFGGLALGSFALHGVAKRSRNPARLFAALETLAAAYALASPYLLHGLARRLPPLLGPAAGDNDTPLALVLSLATALLVLLPATVAMGATLAALVEARRRVAADETEGRGLGRLYGANTFGATLGVLATVHVLLPWLGLETGAATLALVGLAAAALGILWSRGVYPATESESADLPARPHPLAPSPEGEGERRSPRLLYLLLFGTGLAGVGLEVVGVQILAQPLEDTIYTFADILAVYLLGTAAGAWIYGLLAERLARRPARAVTAVLLLAHLASVFLAAFCLRASPWLLARLAPEESGFLRRFLAEFGLAALLFLVPTLLMGALASHLLAQVAARGVGRAYGFNTLGATLSPFLFGLVAIPALGYAGALYLVAWAYLAIFAVAVLAGWEGTPRPAWTWAAPAMTVALTLVAPRSLALVEVQPGWVEVASRETLMGLVRVTEKPEAGTRLLQVNKHFRMGGGSAFGERRMGHIPLLLAPRARTALFLGIATGGTLGAVRDFPLARVDAVEIVPVMLEMLPLFDRINQGIAGDPRVRFHAADARRYVAASPNRYDVIVADLFHPARDGAGTLYSREHFAAVRGHLSPGGLFAQWIPLYQFDARNLKTVVRTFLAVFPEVHSFLGIYNAETPALVLLGRAPRDPADALAIDLDRLEAALRRPIYRDLLMQDARDLLAAYMLDRPALARFGGEGPLNTDLNPRVLFDAPRSAYENRPELRYRSLTALLPYRTAYPTSLVTSRDPRRLSAFRTAAGSYGTALSHYLKGDVLRAAGAPELPPAAREQYLLAYEADPGFVPAGQVLLALAEADPGTAEPLFRRMLARTPDRPRLYLSYLAHLDQIGDKGRAANLRAEIRSRFTRERFQAALADPIAPKG
jgi:spermidine synthase